jgi:hypothetical protein
MSLPVEFLAIDEKLVLVALMGLAINRNLCDQHESRRLLRYMLSAYRSHPLAI